MPLLEMGKTVAGGTVGVSNVLGPAYRGNQRVKIEELTIEIS